TLLCLSRTVHRPQEGARARSRTERRRGGDSRHCADSVRSQRRSTPCTSSGFPHARREARRARRASRRHLQPYEQTRLGTQKEKRTLTSSDMTTRLAADLAAFGEKDALHRRMTTDLNAIQKFLTISSEHPTNKM